MELTGKPLNLFERFFLWLYLFSFCFDFKGKEGGSAVQFVLVGISLIAAIGLILLLIRRKTQPMSVSLKQITIFWWVYLASTLLVLIVEVLFQASDVTVDHYVRVILPYVICGISLVIILLMQTRSINPKELILPLVLSVLLSAVWSYFYATAIAGFDVDVIRYQILTPATPFEFAYGVVGTFLLGKFRPLALLSLALAAAIISISVTRTFIITAIFCFSALIYFQFQIPSHRTVKFVFRQSAIFVGLVTLLAIIGVLVILVRPNITLVWQSRVVGQTDATGSKDFSQDITLITRLSEASGMWKETTRDPVYFFFGKGFGGGYRWDAAYSRQILMHGDFPYDDQWNSADTAWPYFLMSSGILFAPMPVIFIFASIYVSFITAKRLVNYSQPLTQEIIVLPFFVLVAYLSDTFTANPFEFRIAGQNIGIMVGLGFWLYYLCVQKQKIVLVPRDRDPQNTLALQTNSFDTGTQNL